MFILTGLLLVPTDVSVCLVCGYVGERITWHFLLSRSNASKGDEIKNYFDSLFIIICFDQGTAV